MMRVIGCGNTDRGDDCVGILVARRLRELGLDAIEHSGDGFALLELWQGCDDIVLVDAMVSGEAPGTVSVWNPLSRPVRAQDYRCSTHVFGPAEAIEIGRALGRLPRRIRIYGIEAREFELGSEANAEVLEAVDRVVCDLLEEARAQRGLDSTGATISGCVVG